MTIMAFFSFVFLKKKDTESGRELLAPFFPSFTDVHRIKHKLMVQFYDDSGSIVSHKR